MELRQRIRSKSSESRASPVGCCNEEEGGGGEEGARAAAEEEEAEGFSAQVSSTTNEQPLRPAGEREYRRGAHGTGSELASTRAVRSNRSLGDSLSSTKWLVRTSAGTAQSAFDDQTHDVSAASLRMDSLRSVPTPWNAGASPNPLTKAGATHASYTMRAV
jgi:hypothetical protein